MKKSIVLDFLTTTLINRESFIILINEVNEKENGTFCYLDYYFPLKQVKEVLKALRRFNIEIEFGKYNNKSSIRISYPNGIFTFYETIRDTKETREVLKRLKDNEKRLIKEQKEARKIERERKKQEKKTKKEDLK